MVKLLLTLGVVLTSMNAFAMPSCATGNMVQCPNNVYGCQGGSFGPGHSGECYDNSSTGYGYFSGAECNRCMAIRKTSTVVK